SGANTLHDCPHIGIMYLLSRSPGMTSLIVDEGAIHRKLAKRWKAVIAMAMTMRIRFTAERGRGVASVGSLSSWVPDSPRRICRLPTPRRGCIGPGRGTIDSTQDQDYFSDQAGRPNAASP